jgi:hypothetical protein
LQRFSGSYSSTVLARDRDANSSFTASTTSVLGPLAKLDREPLDDELLDQPW